jgi:tetratricopeptide (TPR) repeat protein
MKIANAADISSVEKEFTKTSSSGTIRVHAAIAEQGKIYAKEEKYDTALQYLNQALQMAIQSEEPNLFIRHYLECILQVLELKGAYDTVLDYCHSMLQGFAGRKGSLSAKETRELALVYLREGILLIKKGQEAQGVLYLKKTVETMAGVGDEVPLAQAILFMHTSGLELGLQRLLAEQKRLQYFSILHESTDRNLAFELPA